MARLYRFAMNTGKPWSAMDDADLRTFWNAGVRIGELSEFLQRNASEVSRRARELKLKRRWGKVAEHTEQGERAN